MEMTSAANLLDWLAEEVPGWISSPSAKQRIGALGDTQAAALHRMLASDLGGQPSFGLRDAQYNDFYQFNLTLNTLCADILSSRVPIDSLIVPRDSMFFHRDDVWEDAEQAALRANGYQVSSHRLTDEQLARIRTEISDCVFTNRGIFSKEMSGTAIYSGIADGSIRRHLGKNGDTFWLKDLNQLSHKDYFQKLAFDPYILSTVARYLGCCPIHAQTNLWFSFPTLLERNNLSTNAQMFHQDKEFTRFIKVFIYLSDVGEDNGPHCYVEGSHIDEVHTRGVAFSDRIPDEEITSYYPADQVKTLTGPAGTIAFGDTSCVHKGIPVKTGHRAMLQLEYTASLYLSPVCPFAGLSDKARAILPYPDDVVARLTANYNDAYRREFQRIEAAARPQEPSAIRKLLRLSKRYLQSLK